MIHGTAVPDEFGTGLKFVLFRLFTREFVLLGGLKFRGFRVFTQPKRTNFRRAPNSSGTVTGSYVKSVSQRSSTESRGFSLGGLGL
jgi:hypothetical protein